MTDKEMTEIIITKVMGRECFCREGDMFFFDEFGLEFTPLHDDADCMMAWDKFSAEYELVSIEHDECGWLACYQDKANHSWYKDGGYHTDRRRAMCECMIKAVSNG